MDENSSGTESVKLAEEGKAKKKRRCKGKWAKNVKKARVNSMAAKQPPRIACNHVRKAFCEADALTQEDITHFHGYLYKDSDKLRQDATILSYITTQTPKRRRVGDNKVERGVSN